MLGGSMTDIYFTKKLRALPQRIEILAKIRALPQRIGILATTPGTAPHCVGSVGFVAGVHPHAHARSSQPPWWQWRCTAITIGILEVQCCAHAARSLLHCWCCLFLDYTCTTTLRLLQPTSLADAELPILAVSAPTNPTQSNGQLLLRSLMFFSFH